MAGRKLKNQRSELIREAILATITESPGIHYRLLLATLRDSPLHLTSLYTLSFHLKTLVSDGTITSTKD